MTSRAFNLQKPAPVLLGLGLTLYMVATCLLPNGITDLWWQLRLGNEIRITHRIPTHDAFSWTCFGRPIVLHEWGSYLLFAEAFRHLNGWLGIWLVQATLAVTAILLLYVFISRRIPDHPFVAAFLTLLAAHTCGEFFAPRPQLFTYVCLVLSLDILMRLRAAKQSPAPLFVGLVLTQIVWANMHAAGPVFIGLCLTYAAGDAVQGWSTRNDPQTRAAYLKSARMSLICAIVSVASMAVNPNGLGIYRIVTDTVGNKTMPATISEWAPVNFHNPYGGQVEFFLFFLAFSVAASRERRALSDMLALAVLCVAGVYAVRNGPLLALAGAPIVAPYVPSALYSMFDRFPRLSMLKRIFLNDSPEFIVTAAALPALLFGLFIGQTAITSSGPSSAGGFKGHIETLYSVSSVPEDGCAFLEKEQVPTSLKLYNDYDNGAYFIWRIPEYRVFSSTETFVYFGSVLQTYMRLEDLPYNWRHVLAPYQPDLVLMTTADSQVHLFIDASDWAMVYAGGPPTTDPKHPVTFIFIRRLPANQAVIARCRAACPEVAALKSQGYVSAD